MKKILRIAQIIYKVPPIKWGIIPLFLLFFWIFMSEVFSPLSSFSIVVYEHNLSNLTKTHKGELLKGQKVSGEFVAQEDNLGIVSVRFHTYKRINKDSVIFRIKQKGDSKWYYQNSYKVDQFQPDKLFTFGFPVIFDSKGKTYQFEIESVKGKKNDAVSISTYEPVFVSKYSFSKSIIFHNPKQFLRLMVIKAENSFSDFEFYPNSMLFLLPLLFYILIQVSFPPPKWAEVTYGTLFFLAVIADVFFVDTPNLFVLCGMVGLWTVMITMFKFDSSVTFLTAFVSLLCVPFMLIFNQEHFGEQFALLTYSFLLIGFVQLLLENDKKKQYVTYKTLLNAVRQMYEKK